MCVLRMHVEKEERHKTNECRSSLCHLGHFPVCLDYLKIKLTEAEVHSSGGLARPDPERGWSGSTPPLQLPSAALSAAFPRKGPPLSLF